MTIKTQLLSLVPLLYSTGVSITNRVFRFPLLYECKISKSHIWFILKKFVKHMEFLWFPCFEHQFSSTKILPYPEEVDLSRVVEESVDRQLKVNRWERLTMVLMLHLGSKVLIDLYDFFEFLLW